MAKIKDLDGRVENRERESWEGSERKVVEEEKKTTRETLNKG